MVGPGLEAAGKACRISKDIFIKAFFDSCDNVQMVKEHFGAQIELNILTKDYEMGDEDLHLKDIFASLGVRESKRNSDFSDFFTKPAADKAKVIRQVLREANEEQRKVIREHREQTAP